MQDRYVGDIGDFVKLALLRSLSPNCNLGVVWYLIPDESHNNDGRHIDYLRKDDWRRLDPELFEGLKAIVASGERSVGALERSNLLRNCRYASGCLSLPKSYPARAASRKVWLRDAAEAVSDCDLVFLDPDNGLQPEGFRSGAAKAIKSVSFSDLSRFKAPGRTLILYHHQTRRPGGHAVEIGHNATRLRKQSFDRVDALRAKPYSPRVFFLLNASDDIRTKAAAFAAAWGSDRVTWRKDAFDLELKSGMNLATALSIGADSSPTDLGY
jgi:hypothetical protein